jgi:hypothetical protein
MDIDWSEMLRMAEHLNVWCALGICGLEELSSQSSEARFQVLSEPKWRKLIGCRPLRQTG